MATMTLTKCAFVAGVSLALGSDPEGCNTSIVGAGWAGIYSAWRLVVDEPHTGNSVCLFEAYNRPGGRTYSTRIDDYMVDVGAYRFALDMHLPADLISALGLLSACYDPSCRDDDLKKEVKWPYKLPLSKIVDFEGRHVGYAAALYTMLAQFEAAGGRLFLGAELNAISRNRSANFWDLTFTKLGHVTSRTVLLNLPRSAHARVLGLEEAASSRWAALHCLARQFPPSVAESSTTTKVYAIYEDAWWVSKLGLLQGVLEDVTAVPPISIHYHDGEVLCADARDPGGGVRWLPSRQASHLKECRGVLQVFYRHSATCPSSFPKCMEYWTTLPRHNMSDPLTVVSQGPSATPQENALRTEVHKKLIDMHEKELLASGLSTKDIASLALPTKLIYSIWYHEGTFPKGDHHMLSCPQDVIFEQSIPRSCGVDSIQEYEDAVEGTGSWAGVAPGLHFMNNDFTATQTAAWHGPWAEQSLLGAERTLAKVFGLRRPSWLNTTYYEAKVLRISNSVAYV